MVFNFDCQVSLMMIILQLCKYNWQLFTFFSHVNAIFFYIAGIPMFIKKWECFFSFVSDVESPYFFFQFKIAIKRFYDLVLNERSLLN